MPIADWGHQDQRSLPCHRLRRWRPAGDRGRPGPTARVAASLDRAAGIHDHDLVGGIGQRKAVGDDQHGAASKQPGQRIADQRLAPGIQAGRDFIQDEDRRILQERPSDGQTLPLPAAQPGALLAQRRIVAARQRLDELVGVSSPGRSDHGIHAGLRPREADIVGDGAVEEVRQLRHPRNLPAPHRPIDAI